MFKKLKLDGLLLSKKYICPKNTFLQLKHYIQRIYLTLLSTTMKIHQIPHVIFEIMSHFSRHNLSLFFLAQTSHTYEKYSIKVRIFRFSTARVKIHQILSFFKQKVSFSSKFGSLFSVMRDNSSVLF